MKPFVFVRVEPQAYDSDFMTRDAISGTSDYMLDILEDDAFGSGSPGGVFAFRPAYGQPQRDSNELEHPLSLVLAKLKDVHATVDGPRVFARELRELDDAGHTFFFVPNLPFYTL